MRNTDFGSWQIGQKDNHGYTITHIHTAIDDYIIYEVQGNALNYDEKNVPECTKKLSAISNEMSIISMLTPPQKKRSMNVHIAMAWRECFNDNIDFSKQILHTLINKMLSKGKEYYILSALGGFGMTLLYGLLFICTYHIVGDVITGIGKVFDTGYQFEVKKEWALICKILVISALGGVVSVLLKLKELTINPQTHNLNMLSGFSRILISMAGGFIFYVAYQSEMFFGTIKKSAISPDTEIYLILLLAFMMGFWERVIPEFSNQMKGLMKNIQ